MLTNVYGVLAINSYDIKNRLTNTVDASGITNSFTYDVLNRVLTRTAGDGGSEKFAYSVFGLSAYTNQIHRRPRGFEEMGWNFLRAPATRQG